MSDDEYTDGRYRCDGRTRRRFLAGTAAGTVTILAGCASAPGGSTTAEETDGGPVSGDPPWYGSGPGAFEARPEPGGTSMDEMPDLSGTLNVYSGRGEALVGELIEYIEDRYSDFTANVTYNTAQALANKIQTEGANTRADVFYSVNAGALGFLESKGRTKPLRKPTTSLVPTEFRANDGDWVGTSGRARTVPYNTKHLSASDVPEDIMKFPDLTQYEGEIGWAPTYSSFQGFVTAMIILEGKQATRKWLNGMQKLNVQTYSDEFAIAQAVADGELKLGLTNHYYIQRVLAGRPEAPIDTAFTKNDAGSVFNVAGAARIKGSGKPELADLFVRHLLSSEAQEYFAVKTFEYPLVEGVEPVGRLPSIDELAVPNIKLSKLSNLDRTVQLLQNAGVL